MLNWSWWLRAILIAVGLAAILVAASLLIPYTAEICTPNEYTHAKECAEHHIGPFALLWAALVVDSHNGVVTAIATVFLTVLTGLLASLAHISYTTGRTQLSAFVFVDDMRHFYEIDPKVIQPTDKALPREVSGWAFRPNWRNSGETQTRNMRTHVDYELINRALPASFPFKENYVAEVRMFLGPKTPAIGGSPKTFSVAEMAEVQSGKKYLYMWGWVRYETIFEPGKERLSRYCVQVVVIGDPTKTDCTFSFPIQNRGNCSDDECVLMGLP